MDTINPYQSPSIPAELLEPQWPAGGAYRDGSYLVLHHASTLPPICVKTGRPAETEQELELIGGLPNDGSVPASGKKWYGDKVYSIRLPLSHRAVHRAALMQRAGLSLAVLLLLTLFLLAWFYSDLERLRSANGVLITALVGLIISVALLTE